MANVKVSGLTEAISETKTFLIRVFTTKLHVARVKAKSKQPETTWKSSVMKIFSKTKKISAVTFTQMNNVKQANSVLDQELFCTHLRKIYSL